MTETIGLCRINKTFKDNRRTNERSNLTAFPGELANSYQQRLLQHFLESFLVPLGSSLAPSTVAPGRALTGATVGSSFGFHFLLSLGSAGPLFLVVKTHPMTFMDPPNYTQSDSNPASTTSQPARPTASHTHGQPPKSTIHILSKPKRNVK